MKAIDYRILRHPTIADLQRDVTEHLNAGYTPLQGADFKPGDGWYQTVVKYAPEERIVTVDAADDYTIPLDIDDALTMIWKQIEGTHKKYVELQFEGRVAYGHNAAGNPLPPRPTTLADATRLLSRMSIALGGAVYSIAAIREGARPPKMPNWLEIGVY